MLGGPRRRDTKSCEEVAEFLLLDDDTVRTWYGLFESAGVEGLSDFKGGGSPGQLTEAQKAALKAWVTETLPRSRRVIGAWIEKTFGISYETRGGLIKLLNRNRHERLRALLWPASCLRGSARA